jgi:hypothetical protein
VAEPNKVVDHFPPACAACGSAMTLENVAVYTALAQTHNLTESGN